MHILFSTLHLHLHETPTTVMVRRIHQKRNGISIARAQPPGSCKRHKPRKTIRYILRGISTAIVSINRCRLDAKSGQCLITEPLMYPTSGAGCVTPVTVSKTIRDIISCGLAVTMVLTKATPALPELQQSGRCNLYRCKKRLHPRFPFSVERGCTSLPPVPVRTEVGLVERRDHASRRHQFVDGGPIFVGDGHL